MNKRNPNISIHRHSLSLMDDPERARAARRGEVMHEALGTLAHPASSTELERAVLKAFARLDLDSAQWKIQEDFVEPLSKALALPEMQTWFRKDAASLKEVAIADVKGDVYRPDRVVVGESGLAVVDFKVGKREDAHKEQVANYVALLAAAFEGQKGCEGRKVTGYLVYVDEPAIVEVA